MPVAAPIHVGLGQPSNSVIVNPQTGAVHVSNPDGSITISFNGKDTDEEKDTEFDDNLATIIDESTLNAMGEEILRGIEEDIRSRIEWEQTLERGMELLGLRLDEIQNQDATGAGNISKVYHPILIEAVVRYQANASAELLPSQGPVKVRDDNPQVDPQRVEMAEAFEKDFNHYLTVTRKEYYPDTRRMLFAQGFCGNGFKKIYRCPIRKMPVSDYVAAQDLIVSNDIVSLTNAGRVTHRTKMRHSTLIRMQLAGAYRKVELTQPVTQPTTTEQAIGALEGINKNVVLPSDHMHTLYECYTEYDLPGFKHKDEDGELTGLALPYRITIEKDSRKVMEVRRNWKENDEDKMPRRRFVHYGYIPGFGFYHIGLVHLLGQSARALTAMERIQIDSGMFSVFPGVVISDAGGRQETTTLRVPPAGMTVIKTGGMPLRDVMMPLPYKEPSSALLNVSKSVEDNARRLGGTAEINVGEGRADVPVGTTIALIEQATKVEGAVHKQNHEAQQEEFLLLKELFEEEPDALTRFNKTPARKWETAQEIIDQDIVPASDPNTPSHIHRVMKATGLLQLSAQSADMNKRAVETTVLATLGYSPSAYLNPPGQGAPGPQADPAKMAKVAVEQKKVDAKSQETIINAKLKAGETQAEMQNNERERQSRENIQHMKTIGTVMQQKEQQRADEAKEIRGLGADHLSRQQEHEHALTENSQDHQHTLEEQARDHAHEKDVAESSDNMVSSE